jgi:predicted nucleotidyltransferase component of viral defense system
VIDAQDIIELAGELSLDPSVVEKDYVLGWLLAGIAQHPELGRRWVFKGGTCLKKVFFETYRFSEDLDFTLLAEDHVDEEFLRRTLREVAEWVYREAGIEVPVAQIRAQVFQNPRGHPAAEARIYYRGPLRPRGSLPRIKLDLTADERVVLDAVDLPISHPFGDQPADGISVHCYAYAEVLAEKIRALGDRARPRDLYDVVNLYRREDALEAAGNVREIPAEKCAFKGIPVPTLAPSNRPATSLWRTGSTCWITSCPRFPPLRVSGANSLASSPGFKRVSGRPARSRTDWRLGTRSSGRPSARSPGSGYPAWPRSNESALQPGTGSAWTSTTRRGTGTGRSGGSNPTRSGALKRAMCSCTHSARTLASTGATASISSMTPR